MGDPRGVLVVAHRGDWCEGRDPAPANSIHAVLAALAAGADGAEVDARLTADESVVLHHDPAVGMPDLREGCRAALGTPVCDLARRELAHLSTLADLLDAMEGWASGALAAGRVRPVMLNIELKDLPGEPGEARNDILARDIAQMLVRRRFGNWPRDCTPVTAEGEPAPPTLQVVVSSFDAACLDRLRGHAPGLATALLLDERDDWRYQLDTHGEGLQAVNPAESLAEPELFRVAAARGLAVLPWTVDDPRSAARLASLGAAGLITNRPRAVAAALRHGPPEEAPRGPRP
jgi:glycerophosphoryl diester phosphodiesterase